MSDEIIIAAAGASARHRDTAISGAFPPGSNAHKAAFCHRLLDTHNRYRPADIEWPDLDAEARDRLVGRPIREIAVQTGGKASARVRAYAGLVSDRLRRFVRGFLCAPTARSRVS